MYFLRNLERRFGKYAIRDLPAVIIGLYAAGYILSVIAPGVLGHLTLDPYFILRGEVWRIITWIIVPPGRLDIFTVIMLFFYFSIGRGLEQKWGAFLFNLYFFMGMLFTVIGAFLVYGWYLFQYGQGFPMSQMGYAVFSTYYINMSIFMAFALSYPDATVLLYFIIPVKMKWMGVLYGVLIVYSFIQSTLPGRVLILTSLLNFLIFWLLTRNGGRTSGGYRYSRGGRAGSGQRTGGFAGKAPKIHPGSTGSGRNPAGGSAGAPLHRCAVCGRTERDSDQLEFRYCSKCAGAYEYCQDHLFTHTHVKGPE